MHSNILFSCFIAIFPLADDGPAHDVPQLKALDHYSGHWDVDMTLQSSSDTSESKHFAGTVVGRWVLQGRFLEQTGTYRLSNDGPPLIIRTLMTFDAQKDAYRYWYFLSTGQTYQSTGQWDDKSQTMTSTIRDPQDGGKTIIKACFEKKGIESWNIETETSDGKVTSRITGQNTLRK